jgi:hypothetical protein
VSSAEFRKLNDLREERLRLGSDPDCECCHGRGMVRGGYVAPSKSGGLIACPRCYSYSDLAPDWPVLHPKRESVSSEKGEG